MSIHLWQNGGGGGVGRRRVGGFRGWVLPVILGLISVEELVVGTLGHR